MKVFQSKVKDLTEESEIYCDEYNVRAIVPHHDGTNYYLYREIKEEENIDNLLDKIYNGEEITSSMLSKYTKSLRPMVQNVYGF